MKTFKIGNDISVKLNKKNRTTAKGHTFHTGSLPIVPTMSESNRRPSCHALRRRVSPRQAVDKLHTLLPQAEPQFILLTTMIDVDIQQTELISASILDDVHS